MTASFAAQNVRGVEATGGTVARHLIGRTAQRNDASYIGCLFGNSAHSHSKIGT